MDKYFQFSLKYSLFEMFTMKFILFLRLLDQIAFDIFVYSMQLRINSRNTVIKLNEKATNSALISLLDVHIGLPGVIKKDDNSY